MSCRLLLGCEQGCHDERAIFFDSVTEWAFGPVMDSEDMAVRFSEWLPDDPRKYDAKDLEEKWAEFQRLPKVEASDGE